MIYTNGKPFIAGNWKLHNTISEAIDLVKALHEAREEFSGAQMVVIPTYTALSGVRKTLESSPIKIGAQNLYWEEKGAFTGEVSGPMLKDAGCEFVIIGHSERRQYFGETNETVNKKIRAAFEAELTPILCIGEYLEERETGKTMDKVRTQIAEGLEGFERDEIKGIIFAYEPIWAIGTGLTATPEQAEEVHAFIRAQLSEKYGNDTGGCAIILYGGSVKPANTYSLLKERDINGALVGGASLKADSIVDIAKESIKAYREK
ncbi:triose-phosphate isomerase [Acidobacteriota bacterium]